MCSDTSAHYNAIVATQGITAIFLREPILDWQKEARNLQGAGGRVRTADGEDDGDEHIILKVQLLPCFTRQLLLLSELTLS